MRLMTKDYFTFGELVAQWNMHKEDAAYLAENGHIQISVRVFGLLVEYGLIEPHDQVGSISCPTHQERIDGLLDLCPRDVHRILKYGEAEVAAFRTPDHEYCRIAREGVTLLVTVKELLVRSGERARVEAAHLSAPDQAGPEFAFEHSDEYRSIVIDGVKFELGYFQAQIVKVLHQAWLDGDPWRHGPSLLTAVGAGSPRLVDLFKSQPEWRRLIHSDGRGRYRLELPDRPSPRRLIRG